MENKLNYFNKYLKYKKKYLNLKKQIYLKGGNKKQWGFGIEQEFPIFIKPSSIDKDNLTKMGFEYNLFNLQDIIFNVIRKPYFFAFLNFEKILEIDEIQKREGRPILKNNIDFKQMENDLSEIMLEIDNDIKSFIKLPNKTIFSIISILSNINNKYKLTLQNHTYITGRNRLAKIEDKNLLETDIIYQNSVITIYKSNGNIYITSNINFELDLETDSGGYEIKSDNFRNTTVKAVIKEINDKKKFIKESLKRTFELEDDNIIFMDQETMYYNKKSYTYTGEPEINITLPYIIPNVDIEKFKEQHINLMKSLQYLSPLFLASFTGSYPNSFGDSKNYFETSYRFNEGSRILVTNVDNIYNLVKEDGFSLHYGTTHETIEKIYRNHYDKFKIKFTNDFDYKIEFSVNRNANKFDPAQNNLFGFEWKIIDQYPIKYANNITLFVVMLAQHLQDYNISIPEDPRDSFKVSDNSEWPYQLLENVIYEGWNVYMGNHLEYVQEILKDRLSLDKYYIDLVDNKTAFDLLNSLHNSFFIYYKSEGTNTDIIDCFYPNFKESREYDKFFDLPNINRDSYNNMIDLMKKENITNFNLLKEKVISDVNDEDYDDYGYYLTRNENKTFV